MESAFPAGRSRGVTVAVEGFFAFVWFGWGQADAPSWLVIPLALGTAAGALLAVAGVVVAKRSAGPLPAASDPAVRRRYGIIVGLEFGLLGAGAAVLGATGLSQWIPVWVCFGVGVHFFPLASLGPDHLWAICTDSPRGACLVVQAGQPQHPACVTTTTPAGDPVALTRAASARHWPQDRPGPASG